MNDIPDTFSIIMPKDKEKLSGDYRTKRVIPEISDAVATPSAPTRHTRSSSIRLWWTRAAITRRGKDRE